MPARSWASMSLLPTDTRLERSSAAGACLPLPGRSVHRPGHPQRRPLSWAVAINALGQVVGASSVTPSLYGFGHAFLYQNGTMTDLNNSIAATSGWTLQSATAINDKGQILGYGIGPDGQQETFLLTPTSEPTPIAPQVPEPGTLAFFALAAAVMAIRRARRRRRS